MHIYIYIYSFLFGQINIILCIYVSIEVHGINDEKCVYKWCETKKKSNKNDKSFESICFLYNYQLYETIKYLTLNRYNKFN